MFDKKYIDYKPFNKCHVGFGNRVKGNAIYEVENDLSIDDYTHNGISSDEIIKIERGQHKKQT